MEEDDKNKQDGQQEEKQSDAVEPRPDYKVRFINKMNEYRRFNQKIRAVKEVMEGFGYELNEAKIKIVDRLWECKDIRDEVHKMEEEGILN